MVHYYMLNEKRREKQTAQQARFRQPLKFLIYRERVREQKRKCARRVGTAHNIQSRNVKSSLTTVWHKQS